MAWSFHSRYLMIFCTVSRLACFVTLHPMIFFASFHTWLVSLLSASYEFHSVAHLAHFLFCRPLGPVTVGQENARQGSSMRTSWRTYSDFQCQRTSVGHSLQSPFRYIFHFNINVIMFLKHNELYFLKMYFAAKTC